MKKAIKKHKKSDAVITGIFILLIFVSSTGARAQDESGIKTVLKLEYFHIDSVQNLNATLQARVEGRFLPLQGMEIDFKYLQGSTEKSMGAALTDEEGKVTFPIPDDILATKGDKGIYSFAASYSGNNNYNKSSATTAMKPLRMEISFSQKGQEKMIDVIASEPGKKDTWVPVDKLDIQFYVPRTFSLLKVGKSTITNGLTSLEFPTSIPGNQLGYLTIMAKVEDNESYGNVAVSGTINWGKPLPPMKMIKRGLGDTDAPLWMVYTLIVLLSFVWFHYIYVIFTVFRIRNLGKS